MWQRGGVNRTGAPTYRALFAVPGFGRLGAATVVARTGATMQSLVLVLFVLQRFHSPPLAGLVVFLSLVPGILLSPVAGALLDRHRRMLLINLDYAIAAGALSAIAALDAVGRLPVAALLLIVAVSSLTNPLSNSGTRSLFPIMVPRRLWERANAVDSGAYVVAAIAGPAVAGLLIGVVGSEAALLATAGLYVAGLLLLLGMTEPALERMATTSLAGDALAGLGYVVRHRELRGLAVATAVSNIAFGIISVGMPVLLLTHLHVGDGSVGLMYAVMGVAGLASGVVAGRMDSERREVWFVVVGCAVSALSMLTMLLAAGVGGGLVVVALAMALFGIANGPFDIGLFSLRQRVTAPAWMGRAFAVSMSLNFVGMPIGSAIAGPIVEHSIPVVFAVAVVVDVIAGVAAILMLRPRTQRARGSGGGDGPSPDRRPSPLAAE
jgi:MFS family permease